MTKKHTPGDWQQSGNIIYSQDNGVICQLSEIREGDFIQHRPVKISSPDWDEAMANGQLIKAAPDLLRLYEACRAFGSQLPTEVFEEFVRLQTVIEPIVRPGE